MRPFRMILFAAIFSFCLALVFPVRTVANITTGTASCSEGKITQMPNGAWGCIISLPVRPPHHGGASNPNDWGMCGVLGLSGSFGPPTVARIIVEPSGYYGVELEAYTPKVIPTLVWTCVLFTDFTGVPPVSEASYFAPPLYNGGSAGGGKNITGSAGNACIWAGLFGDLETPSNEGGFGYAFAQFYGPETVIGSQNVSSYAFCSGYTTPSWHGWNYFHHGGGAYAPSGVVPLGVNEAHYWCYMDNIQANLLYPNYSIGPISANLKLSGGNYAMEATPAGGTWMNFNCLPLAQ